MAGPSTFGPTDPFANSAFTHVIHGVIEQTEDATPKTIFSLPIGEEKVVLIEADVVTFDLLDMNPLAKARIEGVFFRRVAGNLTRPSLPKLTAGVSNFSAPQPVIDLAVNVGTQSVDFNVTGKAGMILRWYLQIIATITA